MTAYSKDRFERLRDLIVVGPTLMVCPLPLITIYLWLVDGSSRMWGYTDVPALLIVLLLGVFGVFLLPISRIARAVTAVVYVGVIAMLIVLWAISFRGGF